MRVSWALVNILEEALDRVTVALGLAFDLSWMSSWKEVCRGDKRSPTLLWSVLRTHPVRLYSFAFLRAKNLDTCQYLRTELLSSAIPKADT